MKPIKSNNNVLEKNADQVFLITRFSHLKYFFHCATMIKSRLMILNYNTNIIIMFEFPNWPILLDSCLYLQKYHHNICTVGKKYIKKSRPKNSLIQWINFTESKILIFTIWNIGICSKEKIREIDFFFFAWTF